MKKIKITLFIGGVLIMHVAVNAQKWELTSGSFNSLKGQSQVCLQYDYSNLKVGEMDEKDYIARKVNEYNLRVPGDGDRWLVKWKNDRIKMYQPQFERALNIRLEKINIKADTSFTSAPYTLVVKTLVIEPGWNGGVVGKSEFVNVDVCLVETGNPAIIIGTYSMNKIPSASAVSILGFDYASGDRIAGAFGTSGIFLGQYLKKILKK